MSGREPEGRERYACSVVVWCTSRSCPLGCQVGKFYEKGMVRWLMFNRKHLNARLLGGRTLAQRVVLTNRLCGHSGRRL